MKIRSCVKWSLRRGEKQWKNIMHYQKVIAVAYERWSFTRGFNYRALTGKNSVFWIGGHYRWLVGYERWSLTRDGRTWRFDCIINTKITCLIAYLPMKDILLVKSFFAPFSLVQTRFLNVFFMLRNESKKLTSSTISIFHNIRTRPFWQI